MIRALYNCISNKETWVIQYYSCFSPKTQFTVSLWTHHDNRTHLHAAHLRLYLLFKITGLYAADYNTDFTIGLLFQLTGLATMSVCSDYRSYFEWMIKTGPSEVRQEKESLFNSETVEGTAFGLYLMHNANVLGHWGCVPPFTIIDFRLFSHPREQSQLPEFTCFTCNTCLLTIPFKNIGGHAVVIGLIWCNCRDD